MSRAQRKKRTRDELLDAAYAMFTQRGFHATSLDLVAAEAGYTKGAVYSNFASKEDLFFAVYEREIERRTAQMERLVGEMGPREFTIHALERRRADDGWLAVFFEFWAHVLRHAELRERFLAGHRRAQEPLIAATAGRYELKGTTPERFTRAMFALVSGLGLEALTEPGLDTTGIAAEMLDLILGGDA